MKPERFDEGFLLETQTARTLYRTYAEHEPIIDFHCHISPAEIDGDARYPNLTKLWLGGDHYKWRVMRSCGVDETYITGPADDWEKFKKWAKVLPLCAGNPLYAWSHMELRRYFGITQELSPETARPIWDACNKALQSPGFSVRGILRRSNVAALCTTDDPLDTLEHHRSLRSDPGFPVLILPAFRPDALLRITKPGWTEQVRALEKRTGIAVTGTDTLWDAVSNRIHFFHEMGCRLSDHALGRVDFQPAGKTELELILAAALCGRTLTPLQAAQYRTWLLLHLSEEYARLGWVMQLHIGALRNANTRSFASLGPDTGYDAVGAAIDPTALQQMLNRLHERGALPKTVLYSLNPNDYETLLSLAGCFSEQIPGKVQMGAAWWFNDHRPGIERMLTAAASLGVLGQFIGMVTDSRSFISYPRHEYFRRILCNLLGRWMESGEMTRNMEAAGVIVRNLCGRNAARLLGIPEPAGSGETSAQTGEVE